MSEKKLSVKKILEDKKELLEKLEDIRCGSVFSLKSFNHLKKDEDGCVWIVICRHSGLVKQKLLSRISTNKLEPKEFIYCLSRLMQIYDQIDY